MCIRDRMWDSSISSGNLQAFPAWKILWGKWFPLFSSGTWMSEREPGESKGQKMAWYTGSEKVWSVYCQMAWITDSVTGIHCSTSGECEGGQHGCTAEILPYSVSDGRILQWVFPENRRGKKGILLNTIEIIGSQRDEFFGCFLIPVVRVKERLSCFLTKICK